jgi:hypothetical protein
MTAFAALLAAAIVAAGGLVAWQVAAAARRAADDAARQRRLELLALLAPAAAAARDEPRSLLTWYPVATRARALLPDDCAALDTAGGSPFPFGPEQVQEAHARWTTAWLTWEGTHDAEYKLRITLLEQELGDQAASPAGRARLDAVAREKLERYQRQYEDYTRVSKALRALGAGKAST